MSWQVQEAKQRFSELLRRTREEGPQVVTRHGEKVAVVISAEDYLKLAGEHDFKAFLLSAPDMEDGEIIRAGDRAPVIDL